MALLHLPNFSLAPSALAVAYPSSFGGMCVQNTSHASTVFVYHLIITNGWWFREVINNNVPIVWAKTTRCLCRNFNFFHAPSALAIIRTLMLVAGNKQNTGCGHVLLRDCLVSGISGVGKTGTLMSWVVYGI